MVSPLGEAVLEAATNWISGSDRFPIELPRLHFVSQIGQSLESVCSTVFLWCTFEVLSDEYVFVLPILGHAPEGNNSEIVLVWILTSNGDVNRSKPSQKSIAESEEFECIAIKSALSSEDHQTI